MVGDHCTDETENVVMSFRDPRIRFFNLEKNSGQQAVPNNFGIGQARGTYIAFLNQDDMYFPDHLSKCLDLIEKKKSDIVVAPQLSISRSFNHNEPAARISVETFGSPLHGKYTSYQFYFASGWLMRTEVFDRVGLWQEEKKLYSYPSQEWLFRAWHKGLRIDFTEMPTVLAIPSGTRENSLLSKESSEHKYFFDRMASENLREFLLAKALKGAVSDYLEYRYERPWHGLFKFFVWPIKKFFVSRGVHQTVVSRRRFLGKGFMIKRYRKKVGLD